MTATAAMAYCPHRGSPTIPARVAQRSAARSQAGLRFEQTSGRPCPHIGRAGICVVADMLPSRRGDPSLSSGLPLRPGLPYRDRHTVRPLRIAAAAQQGLAHLLLGSLHREDPRAGVLGRNEESVTHGARLVVLRRKVPDGGRHILHAQRYSGAARTAVSDCTRDGVRPRPVNYTLCGIHRPGSDPGRSVTHRFDPV